jgi:tRNA (guanine-N7-)-methyltransferase
MPGPHRVRVRNHVNPLGPAFAEFRGEAPRLAADRPLELELGCADAQFLFQRAARDRHRHYVGIEIREELVNAVNAKAAALEVPVRAVFCNANRHLLQVVPERGVARVFVNFPDPWFKRRHGKRRMITDELGRDIVRLLQPAGELFVQTDVWELALDALGVFEPLDAELHNCAGAWSFWKRGNPFGAQSWREERCERNGWPIWRLYYRRRAW